MWQFEEAGIPVGTNLGNPPDTKTRKAVEAVNATIDASGMWAVKEYSDDLRARATQEQIIIEAKT